MLIDIKNLKKEFITGEVITKVLYGINFSVGKGDFVSIMGPSGSGKSTFMHIIGLLDRATSGLYKLEGKDVTKLSDNELAELRNEKLGFVFQAFNLLPRTSVFDNVILPLSYSREQVDTKKRGEAVLRSVGLEHRMNYFTNQISGGEKQRVAIARALVTKPSIIFADEPTGNLDSKSGVQIMAILQKLNDEGTTVILVTHETFTAEHAKRIVKIYDGLIIEDTKVKKRRFAVDGELLK